MAGMSLALQPVMTPAFSMMRQDDELRFGDEHSLLDAQLEKVIRFAEADDKRSCQLIWELFSRDLEQHMADEERLLLPAFAGTGTAPDLWSERLRAEHEELRLYCHTLGGDFHGPRLQLDSLRDFSRKLLEHSERERHVLYPWLASFPIHASAPTSQRPHVSPRPYR